MLYLATASPDTADAALAEGITEELIVRLSRVDGLRVTSRFGALRYRARGAVDPRQVGRELGVRYVLQGTLRRARDRVRVSVEITDAIQGHNVWAATYDRPAEDVFAMQDSVAVQVASAVRGRLTIQERARLAPRAPAVSPEAYQAYLRARAAVRARTPSGIGHGVAQYRRAVTLDPTFGPAHAGLAQAYMLAAFWGADAPGLSADSLERLGHVAAVQALALDSSSAESWLAAAMSVRNRDPGRGLDYHRRALALDSTNVEALHQLAWGLYAAGQLDSAIATEQRVTARDPYYAYAYATMADLLNVAGRPSEALAWVAQGLAIDSTHGALYGFRADACLRLARVEEARAAVRQAVSLGFSVVAGRILLALATLAEGDTTAARVAVAVVADELRAELARAPTGLTFFTAGFLSGGYAHLGVADSAVAWARRVSIGQLRLNAVHFARHWLWQPLQGDPRFQAILAGLR
ncbi:MAG: hypothetical protein ACREMM_05640 [Gemmatimonadales bacterium]